VDPVAEWSVQDECGWGNGSMARSLRRVTVGTVCRSHDDAFIGTSAVVFEGVTHRGCLEALAYRKGMTLATDLNIGVVIVRHIVLVRLGLCNSP
jgi:hypothetical protein